MQARVESPIPDGGGATFGRPVVMIALMTSLSASRVTCQIETGKRSVTTFVAKAARAERRLEVPRPSRRQRPSDRGPRSYRPCRVPAWRCRFDQPSHSAVALRWLENLLPAAA